MDIFKSIIKLIEDESLPLNTLEVGRNDFLVSAGARDSRLFFVEEGSLRVYVLEEGIEHTIRLAYRNNIISAIDTFITNNPTDFYIQAIKKCRLKVLHKTAFEQIMLKDPSFLKLWNTTLQQLILQQLEREKDLLLTNPLDRYNRVLARSPQLFQEVPLRYIASYLRMTPETLSRIRKP